MDPTATGGKCPLEEVCVAFANSRAPSFIVSFSETAHAEQSGNKTDGVHLQERAGWNLATRAMPVHPSFQASQGHYGTIVTHGLLGPYEIGTCFMLIFFKFYT